MEASLPPLFRLPQELRDIIYSYVLFEEEILGMDDFRKHKDSRPEPRSLVLATKRYAAYIFEREDEDIRLTTKAPLGQVSRHLRVEISRFLESNDFRVVARVQNLSFDHVSRYLQRLSLRGNLARHTVCEDGRIPEPLMLELAGPYDQDCIASLNRWIKSVDELFPDRNAELGALRKTVLNASPQNRFQNRASPAIIRKAGAMHDEWKLGAGRWELEKVFFVLYIRYRVETMMGWHTSPVPNDRMNMRYGKVLSQCNQSLFSNEHTYTDVFPGAFTWKVL